MEFEWDPQKARENRLKHGVDFSSAICVLEDPRALTISQSHDHEDRFITLGMDDLGRALVVVYTWRDEAIRIISARKATRAEQTNYGGKA